MKTIAPIAAAILAGSLGAAASAQPYTISWYTVDGGGGTTGAGSVSLSGTAGQPDAGIMSGGSLLVYGGFWNGASEYCPADFNQSGTVTVQDIFDFLAAWFAADTRADFNHASGITVQDIFDFLAAWFAGCA